MARRRKRLPPGARDLLLEMASSGALYETKAAEALAMDLRSLRRLLKHNEAAAEIWDEALAVERDALLEKMHARVREGDTKAAQWLLAARHGMTDRPQDSTQERQPAVNIYLPAAMSAEQYAKAVRVQPEALEDGTDG